MAFLLLLVLVVAGVAYVTQNQRDVGVPRPAKPRYVHSAPEWARLVGLVFALLIIPVASVVATAPPLWVLVVAISATPGAVLVATLIRRGRTMPVEKARCLRVTAGAGCVAAFVALLLGTSG